MNQWRSPDIAVFRARAVIPGRFTRTSSLCTFPSSFSGEKPRTHAEELLGHARERGAKLIGFLQLKEPPPVSSASFFNPRSGRVRTRCTPLK